MWVGKENKFDGFKVEVVSCPVSDENVIDSLHVQECEASSENNSVPNGATVEMSEGERGKRVSEESNPFGVRLTHVTIEQPSHSDENMVNQLVETSEKKRYLEDEIGEEYKKWSNGYAYFIKAPTGSGKSYFVIHVLLKYIINQHIEKESKRVLYLVNRVVLKKQLEKALKEVENEVFEDFDDREDVIGDYITITTYRNIETGLKKDRPENIIRFLKKFSWVIYDECHYFYTDSTFNTNTELSYDCLRRLFAGKIEVFMSATIDRVRELIIKRPANFLRGIEEIQNMKANCMPHDKNNYEVNIDYRNLNIEPLDDLEMLVACIKETADSRGNKWLVFVDSIEMGRELKRLLTEGDVSEGKDEKQKRGILPEKEVVFINANFAQDAQAEASVDDIVTESYAKEKVVISTSVMDNGVSFHDSELRNMAIFADTKEMFIQMLGRKRWENEYGEAMNLYIFRRNREHFRKRRDGVQEILDVHKEYHEYLNNESTCYVIEGETNEKLLCGSKQRINAFVELYFNLQEPKRLWGLDIQKSSQSLPISDVNLKAEPESWQERPHNGKNVSFGTQTEFVIGVNDRFLFDCNEMIRNQKTLMTALLEDEVTYRKLKKISYCSQGKLFLNHFALTYCRDCRRFYEEMMEALETDEDAFLKKQFEWMGLSEEDQIGIMRKEEEKKKGLLEEEIEKVLDTEMTEQENIEWKLGENKRVVNLVIYFLEVGGMCDKDKKKYLQRTDIPLTDEYFNKSMELAGLPYEMIFQRTNKAKNIRKAYKIYKNPAVE